jgi:hypothetical protein
LRLIEEEISRHPFKGFLLPLEGGVLRRILYTRAKSILSPLSFPFLFFLFYSLSPKSVL